MKYLIYIQARAELSCLALRTEWFRSRERYKRWEEQLVLLKREMVMTIRTFRMRERVWEWKGRVRCPTPGMRVYALKQSRFYGELALRALKEFCRDIQVREFGFHLPAALKHTYALG